MRLVVTEGGKARRTASGVVIGTERTDKGVASYVITNAHAVDVDDLKAPRMVITQERQAELAEYPVEVVATGQVPDMDLALLRVPEVELTPARAGGGCASWSWARTWWWRRARSASRCRCRAACCRRWSGIARAKRPKMVKTDAPIGYGASGGGIFSLETGKLLAIVEGYRTAKVGFAVADKDYSFDVPMPGETFAAPTSKVRKLPRVQGLRPAAGAGLRGRLGQTAQR